MSNAEFLLPLHLQVAVPLRIAELQADGGITEQDIVRVRSYTISEAALYPVEGETTRAINKVVEAVAVLAFMPGGIDICGLHFEAELCH